MTLSDADDNAQNEALAYLLLVAEPGVTFDEIGPRSRSTYIIGPALHTGQRRTGAFVDVITSTYDPYQACVLTIAKNGPMTVTVQPGSSPTCLPWFEDDNPTLLAEQTVAAFSDTTLTGMHGRALALAVAA